MKPIASLLFLALLIVLPPVSLAAIVAGGPEPNVVRWATASEKDNFGYDVYRGLAETGPFERINPKTIPGAGTTDLPQNYEYIDKAVEPNTVYWYYVESISLNGERKRMTPIYPSQAKAGNK